MCRSSSGSYVPVGDTRPLPPGPEHPLTVWPRRRTYGTPMWRVTFCHADHMPRARRAPFRQIRLATSIALWTQSSSESPICWAVRKTSTHRDRAHVTHGQLVGPRFCGCCALGHFSEAIRQGGRFGLGGSLQIIHKICGKLRGVAPVSRSERGRGADAQKRGAIRTPGPSRNGEHRLSWRTGRPART